MPCEENAPLTPNEVELLTTYRSWAKKSKLVDKLQQKMEKLAARENIPRTALIPLPLPPSQESAPADQMVRHAMNAMAPEETEAEKLRRRRNSYWEYDSDSEDDEWDRYDHSDPRVAAAFAAMSAPGYIEDQYSLECELALRGYYDAPPGEELPVIGGKKK